MVRAPVGSSFSEDLRRRARLAAVFTLLGMSLAASAAAQDAGVSGIPQGPGNVNGLNNTGRDPSGIGNAARVAPLPQPSLAPVPVPSTAPVYSSRQPPLVRAPAVRDTTPRSKQSARARRAAEEARIKENDRLLQHGVTSICRGC
jgi:hypothetical protein